MYLLWARPNSGYGHSKIYETESLPLRNTHSAQGVLVNTCTTTSVDTMSII